MKPNVALLQKIHDHIERFPQSVDMDHWHNNSTRKGNQNLSPGRWDGFSGCVGGLCIYLTGGKFDDTKNHNARNLDVVRARLGLTATETSDLIFFDHTDHNGAYSEWKDDLLRENVGTVEYADVVRRVLRACISRHTNVPHEVPPIKLVVKMSPSVAASSRNRSWRFWRKPDEVEVA